MTEAYSRLYHKFGREYPEVYADDRLLAPWVRLLVVADASWPLRPPLPRSLSARAFRHLSGCGLLIVDGESYTVLGLDAERSRRSDAGRIGAAKRWHSDGNAIAMPRRDETNRDEPSKDETSIAGGAPDDGRVDLEAFLAVRFRIPTPAQRDLMDAYIRVFDVSGPQRAADLILRHPDDPIGALKADLAEFRKQRIAEAQAVERPAPIRKRRKGAGFTGVNAELQAFFTERYATDERAYQHNSGAHADEPDQACASCTAVPA
jgi:hypothetical protein